MVVTFHFQRETIKGIAYCSGWRPALRSSAIFALNLTLTLTNLVSALWITEKQSLLLKREVNGKKNDKLHGKINADKVKLQRWCYSYRERERERECLGKYFPFPGGSINFLPTRKQNRKVHSILSPPWPSCPGLVYYFPLASSLLTPPSLVTLGGAGGIRFDRPPSATRCASEREIR